MEKACTYFLQLLCILSIGCSLIEGLLVEETSHVRLSCLSTTDSQRLVVTYSNNTKETLSIFTSSECNVPRSDIRCITLDNVVNTLLIVELEVSNQTRTIVSYSCGGGKVTNITFYAKPSNLSCGPPVLDESESNVLVTCTVGKIYPQPGCVFYDMSNNSVVERLMTNVRYVQWGSPVYYSAECTIQITLINQTQVHEEILVNVYPNVDNNNGSIYGVNYTAVHQLKIEPASVKIDPSCPQGTNVIEGYIKNGTKATCKCLKMPSANVLSRVHWYQNNQRVSANETDPSLSTLTVSYPKDLNKSYQCKAAPLTTEPNGLTFYPQFAFGPQSLLVDFNETTVDLCSAESKTIPINVWVSKSDVSPDIRVKTTVEIAARSSNNRNDDYDFSVRTNDNPSSPNINSTIYLTVTSGGKYIVTASFLNIIFNDFKAVTNVNVIVREPPPKQPIFIINGGEHMKEGITTSNINLTCYAPGGYPEVSEITISCIGRTITKSGNTLTVKMDFEKKDNGSVCVCQATHKSGCYTNNVASLIINITYIVNITTFTVKNETSLEVPEGQNVPLSCSVESYPRPVISINKKDVNANDNMLLTSEPTEVAANIWQSQYTILSVRCDDVHTYTCRATHLNSYMTVESNVSFTVKCHFRLKNGAIVKEEIGAVLGHDLVFTLEVLGNPQPSKYELLKGLRKHPLENGSFNVGFTPLYVPFGILKLTLFNVQREDLTLFTLVIDNGMQENMTYNFLLFEALSKQQSANTGAIVGGSVGGVILFILMTIIFLNRRRCRKPSTEDLREPDGVEMNRNSNVEPETANPPYEEPAPEVVPRKNPNEVIAGPLPDLGPKIIPRKKNKSEDPEDGIAGPVNVLGPEVIPRKKINSEKPEEVIARPVNVLGPEVIPRKKINSEEPEEVIAEPLRVLGPEVMPRIKINSDEPEEVIEGLIKVLGPEVIPRMKINCQYPDEKTACPVPDLGPEIIPRKKINSDEPEEVIEGLVNVLGTEVIPRKKIKPEQQEEVIAGPFNDIEPRSYQSLHDGSFDGVNERMDSNSNDLSEQNSEHNDDAKEAININSNGLSVPASQHHDEIQDENTSVKAFHFSDMIDQSNSLENNSTLVHSKPPGSVNFLVSTETLKELQIQDDDNMSAESTSLQKSEEKIVPFNDGIFESPLPKTNSGDNEYDHPISNRSLQDKNFYKVPDRNSSLGTVKKLEDFLRPDVLKDGFGTLESIQTPNEVQQQDALEVLNPSYPSSFNQNVNESAPQSSNLLQTQTNDSSV